MRLFLFVASLLIAALSTAARGEERVALVIANSTYPGAPVVATAAGSADLVVDALRRAGFRVRLVTEAGRQPLAEAVVDFSLALADDPGAIGVLYYVGYAAQVEGANYLLPADALISGPGDIASAGVPVNGILNLLGDGSATEVVILDAAWNEGMAGAGVERGLAPQDVPAGTIVAFAAGPGTVAADGNGSTSAYAEGFAAALGEPGLDVHVVLMRARDRVSELTGGRQIVWEGSGLSFDTLVLNAGGAPALETPAGPGSAAPAEPAAGEQMAEVPVPPAPPDVDLPEMPPIFSLPSGGGGGTFNPGELLPPEPPRFQGDGGTSDGSGWPDDIVGFHGDDFSGSGGSYSESPLDLGGSYAESPPGSMPQLTPEEMAEQQRYEAEMAAREQQRYEEAMLAAEAARKAAEEQALGNLGEMYEALEPPPATQAPPSPAQGTPRRPIVPGGGDGVVAEVPVGGADVPSEPRDGEIRPGGGDGPVDDIAPGSGVNFYDILGAYSEPEAWAIVSRADDAEAYLGFLQTFPTGAYFAEAAQRYGELTRAAAAAGEPAPAEPPAGPSELPGAPAEEAEALPPNPAQPAETKLARHPTLDSPDSIVAAEIFTVSVALTEEQLTPDVTARAAPTTSLTPEGAFEFSLPAETEEWPIDIDLLAAGFDLADGGKWSRRVTLYRSGDSDFARFEIKARAISEASKPRQLMARFYHAGRFLGSVSRPISVLREIAPPETANAPPADAASAPAATPPAAAMMSLADLPPQEVLASELIIGGEVEVPDLDVTIHYDDPDNLGAGLIVLHSPHIAGPVSAEFITPAGMSMWLDTEYLRLVQLGLGMRGARSLIEPAAGDPDAQKRFIAKVAEGFGDDLYRNYVPQAFKDVFWSLKLRGLVHSIQITSNSPVLPWELVRPKNAEGAMSDGFLGISYRLARWAPRTVASQVDQPLNRMPFTGVATVAPSYENNQELPFQQTEIDALSKLAGFRLIGGDFGSFEKMVGEVSTGFIHFSGHGEVNDPGTGAPVFAIRLADQLLDPNTWRALTFAPRDRGNPFYFFNACDTGRAASLGGFVQGWGPAVLASGATGFIGGMWPLTDRTAASFSTEFYGGLTGHLSDGPVYLAEVLQGVRKRFYETGDPTYLAYTFYGNANLKVVAQ